MIHDLLELKTLIFSSYNLARNDRRKKEMNRYAYIRVSTKDQNIDRQEVAMKEIGIPKKQMFIDKQSGKDFNRRNYKRLVRRLKKGDEVYIKSIDRLGRNYDEIIEQWRYLTKIKDVDIIILDLPLLDTRRHTNGITGRFIGDLVLQVLSYVAQIERENTHQRQAEGIKVAQEKGIKFGRPRMPVPENFEEVRQLFIENSMSKRECAKLLNTNHVTFSKWVERYDMEELK